MSKETKTVGSIETPGVDPAASEARPAAPPTIASVHARLQDVQLEIVHERAKFDQAMAKYQDVLSTYNAALTASRKDPDNEILTKRLAEAKRSEDGSKFLTDSYARSLALLEGDAAELQETLYKQRGKYLLSWRKPTIQ